MPTLRNKRAFLARQLRTAGVVRLLERVARRPCLLVLGYHRIGTRDGDPFYDGVISATPEAFARQVRYLRDHFRVLALDEALAVAEGRAPLREPCALITFDDGYRDNYEVAFPLLKEAHLPASFFLPTDFLDRPRLFWWDRLAYLLKHTRRDRIVLDGPAPRTLDLTRISRDDAILALVPPFLALAPDDESRWLDHLAERTGVDLDEEGLARALFMTWDHARALAAAGMAIGSHARSHRNLARLPEAEQRRELVESKRALERELGSTVFSLAYPYGVADAVADATRRLAREAGYRLAFVFGAGVNRPGSIDPLAVARVNVGFADSADLFRARAVLYTAFGTSLV